MTQEVYTPEVIPAAQTQHQWHHSSVPYEIEKGKAAAYTKTKFTQMIARAQSTAPATFDRMERERPQNWLIPGGRLKVNQIQNGGSVRDALGLSFEHPEGGEIKLGIHSNALSQMASKTKVPMKLIRQMTDDNQVDKVAQLLEWRLWDVEPDKHHLIRSAVGQARGFLSDSYGIYDVAPVIGDFVKSCRDAGGVPSEVMFSDTTFRLKFLTDRYYEPLKDEVLMFGLMLRGSDYGVGALEISQIVMRCLCTNYQTSERAYRQVHLGKKLEIADLSEATLIKRGEFLQGVMRDKVGVALGGESIQRKLAQIVKADSEGVKIETLTQAWAKSGKITGGERDRILELATVDNVELLPPVRQIFASGETSAYRFSNILSLLGNESGDDGKEERKEHFEKLAGQAMGVATVAA